MGRKGGKNDVKMAENQEEWDELLEEKVYKRFFLICVGLVKKIIFFNCLKIMQCKHLDLLTISVNQDF